MSPKPSTRRIGQRTVLIAAAILLLLAAGAGSARASVNVSLSADQSAASNGQTVTFTAAVTNNGPASSMLLRLNLAGSDESGADFVYVSSQPTGFGSCGGTDQGSTAVACGGTIAEGQTATLAVLTDVSVDGSGGPVSVTATVLNDSDGTVLASAQTTVTVAGYNPQTEEKETKTPTRRGSGEGTGESPGGTRSGEKPTEHKSNAGCVVPRLSGATLTATRKALRKAHCKLGKVTRRKSKGKVGVVTSQNPKPGKHLRAGSAVSIVLRSR